MPTVPGVTATERAEIKGADIGALMWQHVPFSRIQHRALAEGELPLWNRYNSGGVTLFGQGQSVFGNPLHLLPLAANGAAWAWDLKFLLAKWLFAVGAGTIVWSLTRHFPAAILTTFSAPFIGFFIYRVNHPAIFSLCYAPWVLYAWQRAISTRSWREFAPWGAFWLFANFTLLTSGTAKEAVILLVMMNLAGGLMLLCASAPWRQRGRWLITFALLSGLFLLISAPHWLLFVHSLGTAYTSYDLGEAFQIPPGLLVALFDEIFYRPFQHEEIVINPSGNFLMLLGVLSLAVRWRQAWADRTVRALLLAALIPTLLVFGVIPPAWLVALPVLSGIQHIDNTFACPLLILMLVLAGWGWREVWERCGTQEGRVELVLIVALLLGCLGLYLGTAQAILRSAYGDFSWAFRVNVSPWIMHYTAALIAATITGFVILRRTRRPRTVSPAQLTLLALCLFALLWRHGFHGAASNLNYTVVPPARADLYAPSPTIGYLTAATNADPARVAGLGDMFFPGWTGAYALETISGPDALMNRRYRELMIATGIERMWDWRYVVRAQTLAKLRPLYDALNLGYLVASRHDPLAPFTGYESVLRADTQVLRSPTVWPRAFFVDGVSGYSDLDAHVARLREGTGPFAAVDDRDPNLPNELP
ncbi:MAG TPA: hypothetical protein VHF69_14930, partial [Candidatus Synoicihabitans sp.]|nr:hypothetical protein [Candidatus Synoicihabitans sp.]